MNTATPLLSALLSLTACQFAAAQSCTPPPDTEAQVRPSFTRERATVEDVLSTVEDGYRVRAYIVTWHGSRVLVSDPLVVSNERTGDSIDFIASRHDVNGDRILAFTTAEHETHLGAGRSGSSSSQASTTTATGVVEEVLSMQDNGFRFVGYVVRSRDRRIAISDPLALTHYAIGAQIDYLTLRTSSPSGLLLEFQVELSSAEMTSISSPLCGIQPALETGVVDRVLLTNTDGYAYRAYVLEWRGSQIVIDDPTTATNYQAGDTVSFWVSRFEDRMPGSPNFQQFTFDRPARTTVVNQDTDLQTSIAMDSAPVQAVLASDVDGFRSVAYLVNWHDTPVAVADAFATTNFTVGDRITFSVARAATPKVKALDFMLFVFPTSRCARPQPSSDNSTPGRAAKAPTSDCRN